MLSTDRSPLARHVLPEFTERTNYGTRTLDPYSRLLEGRIVFLGTPLDDTAAADLAVQLMHLEYADPDQDISLYLNCPGGEFTALTAVYDTMRHLSCDVATYCLGQAVSVGAVLLAAGAPGKRAALPGARIVLRQPELPEGMRGQPSDLAVWAEELARERRTTERLLAAGTGRTEEEVRGDMERDLVLTAEEAVTYGIVDALADRRAPHSGPR
ncbi:ATP-dependent Clp protease proteolytic subunit [Streptomyces sp. GZWMJZ-114]|uniref:ClpP family protease n=1 Tax=Streptomyces sp. GZWMJZ-114 TaxID=2494734 RepID=UPI001011FB0F|nr:ATP-dependent Clp protease proteolytic subunit [Streptomyces sp. GZWMJZ-114]